MVYGEKKRKKGEKRKESDKWGDGSSDKEAGVWKREEVAHEGSAWAWNDLSLQIKHGKEGDFDADTSLLNIDPQDSCKRYMSDWLSSLLPP